jgi:asparaginyl-tRNA synthetase
MSEFYMLEAEMTFVDHVNTVMDLVEDILRAMTDGLTADSTAMQEITGLAHRMKTVDSDFCEESVIQARWEGMRGSSPRWPRISYGDAIETLLACDEPFEHKPVWGVPLQSEHEKFLARRVSELRNPGWLTPVFVTNYPRQIKPFYMLSSQDGLEKGNTGEQSASLVPPNRVTVECFDLLVPDVCEIAGGSMREHRLNELLKAMERHEMATPSATPGRSTSNLDWYVDLRRWGSPPHGGFGLGFDRLLSYLTGVQNVKDIVAFPRWFGRCDC